LLKPLKKQELLNALDKMLVKQAKEENREIALNDMQKRIEEDTEKLKEALMIKLINGQISPQSLQSRNTINHEYGCTFADGNYQAFLLKPDIPLEDDNETSYALLLKKSEDILYKEIKPYFFNTLVTRNLEGVFCIVNGSNKNFEELTSHLRRIQKRIGSHRDIFLDVSITVGMGELSDNFAAMPNSIQNARIASLQRLVEKKGQIIKASDIQKEYLNVSDIINRDFRQRIFNIIEIFDTEGLGQWFEEIKEKSEHDQIRTGQFIQVLLFEIIDIFQMGCKQFGYSCPNLKEEYIKTFCRCSTFKEAFDVLKSVLTSALSEWDSDKKQKNSKPIRAAKQYIKEHYWLPITLEEIGQEIDLKPGYF
jgi:two-component system, response regulator YesN